MNKHLEELYEGSETIENIIFNRYARLNYEEVSRVGI